MKKRIFAVFAAFALLLSGCAGSQTAAGDTQADGAGEDELRELTVVLDWYPNALHAFLYQAEQAGYFAEEGLTVNIQPPAGVNDAMSMVAAGKADIGLYYQQDVIQARVEQDVPKRQERRVYNRARVGRDPLSGELAVREAHSQNSALLGTLHHANCLLMVPEGPAGYAAGDEVPCVRIDLEEGTVL